MSARCAVESAIDEDSATDPKLSIVGMRKRDRSAGWFPWRWWQMVRETRRTPCAAVRASF
jgi:hypothetical protein